MSKVGMWKMECELAAYEGLKAHMGEIADDMGLDLAEGETGLLEAVDACIKLFHEAKAEEAANKELSSHYSKRAQAAKHRQDMIRGGVDKVRKALQQKNIKRDIGTIYARKVAEKVNILDAEKVPNSYRVNDFTPPPDKDRILAALQAGEEIDGCELIPESEGTSIR